MRLWIDLTDLAAWRGHFTGIQQTVFNLASRYARKAEEHRIRTESHAREVLAHFATLAAEQAVPFKGEYKRTDAVDDAIVTAAQEYGCDLVVMVTHGRGAFGELLFGSHTKNVLSRSKLPLLVLH